MACGGAEEVWEVQVRALQNMIVKVHHTCVEQNKMKKRARLGEKDDNNIVSKRGIIF